MLASCESANINDLGLIKCCTLRILRLHSFSFKCYGCWRVENFNRIEVIVKSGSLVSSKCGDVDTITWCNSVRLYGGIMLVKKRCPNISTSCNKFHFSSFLGIIKKGIIRVRPKNPFNMKRNVIVCFIGTNFCRQSKRVDICYTD